EVVIVAGAGRVGGALGRRRRGGGAAGRGRGRRAARRGRRAARRDGGAGGARGLRDGRGARRGGRRRRDRGGRGGRAPGDRRPGAAGERVAGVDRARVLIVAGHGAAIRIAGLAGAVREAVVAGLRILHPPVAARGTRRQAAGRLVRRGADGLELHVAGRERRREDARARGRRTRGERHEVAARWSAARGGDERAGVDAETGPGLQSVAGARVAAGVEEAGRTHVDGAAREIGGAGAGRRGAPGVALAAQGGVAREAEPASQQKDRT